jgi:hypothetical protein
MVVRLYKLSYAGSISRVPRSIWHSLMHMSRLEPLRLSLLTCGVLLHVGCPAFVPAPAATVDEPSREAGVVQVPYDRSVRWLNAPDPRAFEFVACLRASDLEATAARASRFFAWRAAAGEWLSADPDANVASLEHDREFYSSHDALYPSAREQHHDWTASGLVSVTSSLTELSAPDADVVRGCASGAEWLGSGVEPPRVLEDPDFSASELRLALGGSVSANCKLIHGALASRLLQATETGSGSARVITVHNVALPDEPHQQSVASVKLQLSQSDDCTNVGVGWRIQSRGRRDKVWHTSKEADPAPAVVGDIIQELRKSECH